MVTAKVVIGANFGDEGKGLMTDYFCNGLAENGRVLNVRFNGGAQAGHTVVDGLRRHVFSHIGAGSFNEKVDTYLSSDFIVNPILFRREIEGFYAKKIFPIVYIDRRAQFTLPCDMMINQIVENSRGTDRHGSCGVGIFETIKRGEGLIRIDQLHLKDTLNFTYDALIYEHVAKRLADLGVKNISIEDLALLTSQNIWQHWREDVEFLVKHTQFVDSSILQKYQNIVFEGAQGLLLDKDNTEYFPHLTPSNTGLHNILPLLNSIPDEVDLETCFVTRSYFTRHGAGKFLTECHRTYLIDESITDKTNVTNEFQGNFRYGFFDLDTFNKTIQRQIAMLPVGSMVKIAITHLDETKDMVPISPDEKLTLMQINQKLPAPIGYLAHGPQRMNIDKINIT